MKQNILDIIDLRVLGEALQGARKQRGMKQADAAEIIDVSRTTITAIEQGKRRIKAGELIKLARAYGKQVSDLVRPRPQIAPFPVQFRGPHMPSGWDGNVSFDMVIKQRQALLNARPALRRAYFASSNPLTFYGLPTSEVQDMGNHYAIRLQRAVLQEWKESVPWAKAGGVTIANGGDIAKQLGVLPADALLPE